MADKPLFNLDAEGRWRLAYDSNQWIIQRRKGSARPSNRSGIADSGWRGGSFVGGKKATLERLFREKGISLTPEAQARFDALPEQFLDFVAVAANVTSTSHLEADEAAQIEAEAA